MKQIIHRATFVTLSALLTAFVVGITGDFLGWWDLANQPLLPLFWLISSFALSLLHWATESPWPIDATAADRSIE